jgi:hypothetical protein
VVVREEEETMSRRALMGVVAAVAALGTAGGLAFGGVKQIMPLYVNAASRYANAGLSETYNTADSTQYAECGTNGSAGYCTFRDASGSYYSCSTTDPALIAVIRSMSPESFISVAWDASANCTYVLSYASSRSAVKVP